MSVYLLDTNILIDWYTGGAGQKFLADFLQQHASALGTAWICAVEFLVKAPVTQRHSFMQLIHDGALIVHEISGVEGMQMAAEIRARVRLPLPDCLILATAKTHGLTLATRDESLAKRGVVVWDRIHQIRGQDWQS